jgi:hypothetical protein
MKYIRKPKVIEAIRYTGNNYAELREFAGNALAFNDGSTLSIRNLDGEETYVFFGDYIIKGDKGGFYPCKSAIFEMIYEPEGTLKCVLHYRGFSADGDWELRNKSVLGSPL